MLVGSPPRAPVVTRSGAARYARPDDGRSDQSGRDTPDDQDASSKDPPPERPRMSRGRGHDAVLAGCAEYRRAARPGIDALRIAEAWRFAPGLPALDIAPGTDAPDATR